MAYVGFKKLKAEIANEPGVRDPGAIAASVGRKKYGKKNFQHAAATGHKMKGKKPSAKRHKMMANFIKKNG